MIEGTSVQLVSLIVYVAAIIWGGLAAVDIHRSTHARSVKYIASGVLSLSVLTAVLFIGAQLPWILGGEWADMSLVEILSWLMYDWVNGLTHLAIVLAVRAFMRWNFPAPCQTGGVCPSHGLARREQEQDRELKGMSADIDALQSRIEDLAAHMKEDV